MFGKKGIDQRLLGKWRIDPTDEPSIQMYGDIEMDFDARGNLKYAIASDAGQQVMLMTWRVEGNCIVTDQPSHLREERSLFELSPEGVLTVAFGGVSTRFLRAPAR
jgi:hypothetical protein